MGKSFETVKITGGIYRGRTIRTPGKGTHPMGARERLALFNMIEPYLPGAFVLDAYAGGGTLGIEAISRGASFVLYLDTSDVALKTIRDNLESLEVPILQGGGIKADVTRVARTATDRFTLVLADPPYDNYEPKMITCLARVVADEGIFVASTPEEGPEIKGMEKIKERKYAAAHITVYRKK